MTKDEELEHLRQENRVLREAGLGKDQELEQSRKAQQDLREGLRQAIEALEFLQERVKELEQLPAENRALRQEVARLTDQLTALQEQLAKDSHNSSLPPSSDRFHRQPKSLRHKSSKKPGGQIGHKGHHLKLSQTPDLIELHAVERCECCQQDLRTQPATLPERRQVIDLPVKRLVVTEHRVEQKQCPVCHHVTRAGFPAQVSAPIHYGPSIQALAVYLVQYQL